jgi:hypothetical protein
MPQEDTIKRKYGADLFWLKIEVKDRGESVSDEAERKFRMSPFSSPRERVDRYGVIVLGDRLARLPCFLFLSSLLPTEQRKSGWGTASPGGGMESKM